MDSVTPTNKNTSDKKKTLLGLKLYARLSSKLIKRCMVLAGFNKDESNQSSQLYLYFMGMALDYELERLKMLCSYDNCNVRIVSEKLKVFSKTQFATNEHNHKLEMMKKAMMRYRYDSCCLMVKCMIKVGFSPSATEIGNLRYRYFLRKAIHYEQVRWNYLKVSKKLGKKAKI